MFVCDNRNYQKTVYLISNKDTHAHLFQLLDLALLSVQWNCSRPSWCLESKSLSILICVWTNLRIDLFCCAEQDCPCLESHGDLCLKQRVKYCCSSSEGKQSCCCLLLNSTCSALDTRIFYKMGNVGQDPRMCFFCFSEVHRSF